MSIRRGNNLFRQNDLLGAIEEYKKIPESHPLKRLAESNIDFARRRLNRIDYTENASGRLYSFETIYERPKISIVMPVFNVAPYLDASILSVRYQTYKNLELIIVNDASTDNGMDVIKMH